MTSLRTERLVLREPTADDAPALCAYYDRNRERFAPWDPPRSPHVEDHERWITEIRADAERSGRAATFLAFAGDELVAFVQLNGFNAEGERSAMLSYSVDGAYEGRGYASEAVEAVVRYGFERLGLQVLEAHYHPDNARSGRLLERLGFRVVARVPVVPGLETLMRPHVYARRWA